MKKIILILCFVFISSASFSQLLFDENFSYPAGDSLTQHGWVAFSGTGNALFVTSPGLVYPGYPGSGIGNAASLLLSSLSSQDASKAFSSNQTSGSVYTSFMVSVDSASLAGDYFGAYLPSNSTSNYYARVFVKYTATNDRLAFGVSKSSTGAFPASYSDSIYLKGTTYVVVVKYTFNPGIADDEISLFVFSGAIPSAEPTPTIGPITTTQGDATPDLGKFALRQGFTATGTLMTPTAQVDGIRSSTSWMPSVWNIKLAIQGIYNESTGMLNLRDTVDIYLHSASSPYNIIDSAKSVIDSVTLTGTYAFANAPDGNYYLEVKYRNLPVFRNGIRTWSKAGGESLSRFNGSYDFTTAASKAFGNNMILKGSIYTIYNGDANQDDIVDLTDLVATSNDASSFVTGYVNTDMNGDYTVDLADVLFVFNNSASFVQAVIPSP